MTIEDRLRATTQAVTDAMRPVRPLELPGEQPARVPQNRRSRRWLNWGAPIAAAALVTALALTLALVRQAAGPQPSSVAPASGTSVPGSIPRYYVALAQTGSTSAQLKAVVGDDRTGRTVAVLNPSSSQNFYGVTGAADDRTFVVMNYTGTTKQTTWYLLRLTPGAAHPTQLTKLPMKPLVAHVSGLALSPDGRELAVMWRTATTQTNAVTYLAVYSMSSGAVLHTWITKGDNINAIGGGANGEGLTWVDGARSIEFNWTSYNAGPPPSFTRTLRKISVTNPGSDLLADSRVAVRLPAGVTVAKTKFSTPCVSLIATPSGTLVCGSNSSTDVSFEEVCSTVPPSLATYSGTTGKRIKVLYQWHGQCLDAGFVPVWTDSSASHVITFLLLSQKGVKTSASDMFGVVTDGRFTPLPKLAVGDGDAINRGGLAF